MKRKNMWAVVAIFAALLCAVSYGQTFTDLDTPAHRGKTDIPDLVKAIDANFALIESGAVDGNVDALTINNTLTAISTNGASTNVLVTTDAEIDGEHLADDSVDDDSIDFSDVTGADLTLTDCTVLTATGRVTGADFSIGTTGYLYISGTQLLFRANATTNDNVIDADILH